MHHKSFTYQIGLIIVLFVLLTAVWFPWTALAEDDEKLSIAFLDARETLEYGSPLPEEIEVQLVVKSPTVSQTTEDSQIKSIKETTTVTISDSGRVTETVTVTDSEVQTSVSTVPPVVKGHLEIFNIISDKGQPVPVEYLIRGYPPEGYLFEAEMSESSNRVDPIVITLRRNSEQDWGTYTGQLIASLDSGETTNKNFSLEIGPQKTAVIRSTEVVVTAIGCPDWLSFLEVCPSLGSGRRILPGTGNIQIDGIDPRDLDYYQDSAGGSAVLENDEGRVGLRLGGKTANCKQNESLEYCPEYDIRVEGSTQAGKYTGMFYLDTSEQANDATKTAVILLVRDHYLLSLFWLVVGVLVSLSITRYYQTCLPNKKENEETAKRHVQISKAQKILKELLKHFLADDQEYLKAGQSGISFYQNHADIVQTAEQLSSESKPPDTEDALSSRNVCITLFKRFYHAFHLLYKVDTWYKKAVTSPKNRSNKQDAEKLKWAFGQEMAVVKKLLWIADTAEVMEKAEDRLIKLLLGVEKLAMTYKIKDKPPIPKWENTSPPLPDLSTNSGDSEEDKSPSLLHCLIIEGIKTTSPMSLLRIAIVILSGFVLMYWDNPTFGSTRDYAVTFLWGATADAAITAITNILGSDKEFLARFKLFG